MSPKPINLRRVRATLARLDTLLKAHPELTRDPHAQARLSAWLEKEQTMAARQGQPKGDTTAYVRMKRMRDKRLASGMQTYEVWLTGEHAALLAELKRPGETLSTTFARGLQALKAQDTPGPTPTAGEGLTPAQRRDTILPRLWAMADERLSHRDMANRLNSEGVPTLSGHGQWQPGTISKLLKTYPRPQ